MEGNTSVAVPPQEDIDTVSNEWERAEAEMESKSSLVARSRQSCVSFVCSMTP